MSAPKRLKTDSAEMSGKCMTNNGENLEPLKDLIHTPFDNLDNFDFEMVSIIDQYLPENNTIAFLFPHWMVKSSNRRILNIDDVPNGLIRGQELELLEYVWENFKFKDEVYIDAIGQACTVGLFSVFEYVQSRGIDFRKYADKFDVNIVLASSFGNLEFLKKMSPYATRAVRLSDDSQDGDVKCAVETKGFDPFENDSETSHISTHVLDNCLAAAAYKGNLDVTKYLVETHEADPLNRSSEAFRIASVVGHLELVKYFVEQGAKPEYNSYQMVRNASTHGHLDIVDYFVTQTQSMYKMEMIREAMTYAIQNGQTDIVKYCLSNGCPRSSIQEYDVNIACSRGHHNVLEEFVPIDDCHPYMLRACENNDAFTIDYLIEKGFNGGEDEKNNRATYMYVATEHMHCESVKVLVSGGYDIHYEDNRVFHEAFNEACRNHDMEWFNFLISQCQNIPQEVQNMLNVLNSFFRTMQA